MVVIRCRQPPSSIAEYSEPNYDKTSCLVPYCTNFTPIAFYRNSMLELIALFIFTKPFFALKDYEKEGDDCLLSCYMSFLNLFQAMETVPLVINLG